VQQSERTAADASSASALAAQGAPGTGLDLTSHPPDGLTWRGYLIQLLHIASEIEHALISRVFEGESEGLTRDDILDNITITWLTNTAISGARLYWENFGKLGYFNVKGVSIPVAVSAFLDEIDLCPRSWAERAYPKLIHYNKLDKGGHFAAWEQPQLLSEEVRAGFRSLRKP
jgi:pimeloyl-ACP methyl ester carboxylesterase